MSINTSAILETVNAFIPVIIIMALVGGLIGSIKQIKF